MTTMVRLANMMFLPMHAPRWAPRGTPSLALPHHSRMLATAFIAPTRGVQEQDYGNTGDDPSNNRVREPAKASRTFDARNVVQVHREYIRPLHADQLSVAKRNDLQVELPPLICGHDNVRVGLSGRSSLLLRDGRIERHRRARDRKSTRLNSSH